jgi:hypothetical protein
MPQMARPHRQYRRGSRLHRHAETGDHVGAVAGGGSLRDVAHRAELGGSVVLGDPHHGSGQRQADQRGKIQVHRGDQLVADHHALTHHHGGDGIERHSSQRAGNDQPAIQRVHDLAAFARLDEEGADDRGDDGEPAQHQRIDHRFWRTGDQQAAEQHGGDDGHGVGFEQVGGHAGAVADVVADVVGYHRRVARVVLGDAGLDLAHQVGADVGTLGEDAAAKSGEDGNQRTAEGQTDQRMGRFRAACAHHQGEKGIVAGDAEQAEADHQHSGDGPPLEGDIERRVQAILGRFGCTHVGAHRDVHADVTRQAGKGPRPSRKPTAVCQPSERKIAISRITRRCRWWCIAGSDRRKRLPAPPAAISRMRSLPVGRPRIHLIDTTP